MAILAGLSAPPTDHEAFQSARAGVAAQVKKLLSIQGDESARSFHLRLGKIMWEYCGMARSAAGLRKALQLIPELRAEFWQRVRVPGSGDNLNMELERAGRVADFLDEEIETILGGLTSLIEPLLICFLGVVVGGIVICMFLPIFKLSELVSGH